MKKFRVTTVNKIDAKPVTKQFLSYVQARNVWDIIVQDGNRDAYHYAGLFVVSSNQAQRCRAMVDGKVTRFMPDLAFDTAALDRLRDLSQ